MPIPLLSDLDAGGVARVLNLPAPQAGTEPARMLELRAAIEGIAWKDSVRLSSTANVNFAAPGAAFDGINAAVGDRLLLKNQNAPAENGIVIFGGAAVPLVRADDASTAAELEGAVVGVEEGNTLAGTQWRQTSVNFVIDVGAVAWTPFGTAAPPATEATAGIAEVASNTETNAGVADNLIVTPAKLAQWTARMRQFAAAVGDGAATQLDFAHNLNTRDVEVQVWETAGLFRRVDAGLEIRLPDVNTARLVFAAAPAIGAYRLVVQAKG